MSSRALRKSLPQKTHQERAQPKARSKFGLLEKKKDYKERSKDFHKKKAILTTLKKRIEFKNEDEFNLKMDNFKVNEKGTNLINLKRTQEFDHNQQALMKTQDLNYIKLKSAQNNAKILRMQMSATMPPADHQFAGHTMASSKSKPNHIVFVDDDKDLLNFDPVKHFDTVPELIGRKSNRIRKSTLQEMDLPQIDTDTLKELRREKKKQLAELKARLERKEKLQQVEQEMMIQKALMGKGAKKKVGVDKKGLPVYKWASRRSK